jgi:hypothetical protein
MSVPRNQANKTSYYSKSVLGLRKIALLFGVKEQHPLFNGLPTKWYAKPSN